MSRNSSAKYYQDNKKRLQKRLVNDKVKKKKKGKQKYGRERYENLSEEEKQKLVEYRKRYY